MPTVIVSPSATSTMTSPSPDDRALVLADLVALGQVRIEVVLAVEDARRLISALRPSPVRIAWRTHSSLITGSMPGMAASTRETWLFGSPPKAVEAPENSFAWLVTWAWISMPTTISQSPVAPLMSFFGLTGAFMRPWPLCVPHRSKGQAPRGSTP